MVNHESIIFDAFVRWEVVRLQEDWEEWQELYVIAIDSCSWNIARKKKYFVGL